MFMIASPPETAADRRIPTNIVDIADAPCFSPTILYTMTLDVQREDETLNRPERLRASDVAYSSIRQGLAAGRWVPGSHLRESELAAELGISRTPVREALRKLASEQLVSFEPHLGVRVPGWSNRDIEEIFALRVELESYAAGQAARHATPAQVAELRELAGQIEQAAFGGRCQMHDLLWHLSLSRLAGSRVSWRSAESAAQAR
jgi:DNA-binding GntR family transcriptional regulator